MILSLRPIIFAKQNYPRKIKKFANNPLKICKKNNLLIFYYKNYLKLFQAIIYN